MQNISGKVFREKMTEENVVVLDVRTKAEVLDGIISNAINIDIMSPDFKQKVEQLDKNNTFLVYCRSGNRSGSACGFMESLGFNNLYNLNGGMMLWDGEVVQC